MYTRLVTADSVTLTLSEQFMDTVWCKLDMALDLDWDNKEQKQPDAQHIWALISAGFKNYILADGRLKS